MPASNAGSAQLLTPLAPPPRPVGSLLACNEDGLYCGSLSGGCVEDDLRKSINNRELATKKPEKIKYGVTVEDVLRLGLPCGGTLEVVIEPVRPGQYELYKSLADKIAARLITRLVNIETGDVSLAEADAYEPLKLEGNNLTLTDHPFDCCLLEPSRWPTT